ncbi:hypothetical protein J132_03891 [Termitomyces sp. J132]|nr:hypothetical protein J132_03891 [Termitomyces sp. J132]
MRSSCDIGACVAALAPTVVACVEAAAEEGANLTTDGVCLTGAINAGVNFVSIQFFWPRFYNANSGCCQPAACESCIEDLDLGDTVQTIENDVDQVETEIGDVVGSIF